MAVMDSTSLDEPPRAATSSLASLGKHAAPGAVAAQVGLALTDKQCILSLQPERQPVMGVLVGHRELHTEFPGHLPLLSVGEAATKRVP